MHSQNSLTSVLSSTSQIKYISKQLHYLTVRKCKISLSFKNHTLIRKKIQHGLEKERQMPDTQSRIAHSSGSIYKFMKQTHLYCSPSSMSSYKVSSHSILFKAGNHHKPIGFGFLYTLSSNLMTLIKITQWN